MADDLYDIFFYGSIHQGDELVVTKKRVAKLLNIKDDKIDALFSHPDGIQLKSAAPLKVAEQYKAALTKVGAKCEFQPTKVKPKPKPKLTKPGGPLELIPKSDAAASKERVFTCPACQFEKTLAADEASPELCEKCGVNPDKYERAAAEKLERDKIKKQILTRHQDETEEQQRIAAEKEEAKRRKILEDEIRKELGLQGFLAKPYALYGSASIVLALGIGLGIGSIFIYERLGPSKPTQQTTLSDLALADSQQLDNDALLERMEENRLLTASTDAPSLQAASAINKLSGEIVSPNSVDPTGKSTGLYNATDLSQSEKKASGAGATQNEPPSPLLLSMAKEIEQDREWDQYLKVIALNLAKSQRITDAHRVGREIQSPRTRTTRRVRSRHKPMTVRSSARCSLT